MPTPELNIDYPIAQDDAIDWGRSIIPDVKYHILIGPEEHQEVIKYIQGAKVIDRDAFKTFAARKSDRPDIERVEINVDREEYRLSEILETTPWGLMNKNKTGIGATTLELNAQRDSIVVVPTRALAVSKVRSTGYIEGTEKFKCHYVGSDYANFSNKPSTLEAYLDDPQIVYKKFIVVSDSLGSLIKRIGKRGRNPYEFFLLVDEIDSYQYDNTYRPNMEKVIDYYFKFPQHKRSMLSATVNEFSNPLIKEEPFVELVFIDSPKKIINLIHAPSICSEVAAYIEYLYNKAPEEKILIAYNSIEKILATIKLLRVPIRGECAIYCSERSKHKIPEYYAEFEGDRLQNRVNFITCTYFVGIDIKEQYHLISVSDVSHLYSVLSIDKFTQIAGRCRDENGLLSETLIYNTFIKSYPYNRDELLKIIQTLTNQILEGYDPVIGEYFRELGYDIKSLMEKSRFYYMYESSYPLLREDINGELTKSYLNIDAFLIMMGIKHELYTSPENLRETLSCQHDVKFIPPMYAEFQDKEAQAIAEAKLKIKDNERVAIDSIIDDLRAIQTIEQRREYIDELLWNYTPHKDYLDLFLEFQEYVPFDDLVRVLPSEGTPGKIKEFKNSARFWALDDNHVLKRAIMEKLPIGRIPADQCRLAIADILRSLFSYEITSQTDATNKLQWFCLLPREENGSKIKRFRNRTSGTDFEIVSYDPLDIGSDPLTMIPVGTPVNNIVEF